VTHMCHLSLSTCRRWAMARLDCRYDLRSATLFYYLYICTFPPDHSTRRKVATTMLIPSKLTVPFQGQLTPSNPDSLLQHQHRCPLQCHSPSTANKQSYSCSRTPAHTNILTIRNITILTGERPLIASVPPTTRHHHVAGRHRFITNQRGCITSQRRYTTCRRAKASSVAHSYSRTASLCRPSKLKRHRLHSCSRPLAGWALRCR
jgi:hypothetical protein